MTFLIASYGVRCATMFIDGELCARSCDGSCGYAFGFC